MNKLKPCPFCGSQHKNLMGYDYHKVGCSNYKCKIYGTAFDKEQWNNRAGGWISVDDELPESCAEVYIWPRPDFGIDCHSGYYYKHNNEWKSQSMQCFGVEDHKVNVTHWMPLPAPPKAVK